MCDTFCGRAIYGLLAIGMMAGGHLIDLTVASTMQWVLNNNDDCLYNWLIVFDDSWTDALRYYIYGSLHFKLITTQTQFIL